jgi:hypothetical protein
LEEETMSGWTIKLTVPDQPPRLFVAGESDPYAALILAHKKLGATLPRDRLKTDGQISASVLEQLGVGAGEIKDVTDNPPPR